MEDQRKPTYENASLRDLKDKSEPFRSSQGNCGVTSLRWGPQVRPGVYNFRRSEIYTGASQQ